MNIQGDYLVQPSSNVTSADSSSKVQGNAPPYRTCRNLLQLNAGTVEPSLIVAAIVVR